MLEQRLHPNELLNIVGETPADNKEGVSALRYWQKMMAGWYMNNAFRQQEFLDYLCRYSPIFSPPVRRRLVAEEFVADICDGTD